LNNLGLVLVSRYNFPERAPHEIVPSQNNSLEYLKIPSRNSSLQKKKNFLSGELLLGEGTFTPGKYFTRERELCTISRELIPGNSF
jgi:hypothetical protein